MSRDKTYLFESMPVRRAVLAMAMPTVISQLITVIYNLADTFFIGRLGDPALVAAVTLSMPLYLVLTGVANLFGLGGSSLISRSLGEGNRERASQTSALCIWLGAGTALAYGLLIAALRPVLLPALGATAETLGATNTYLFWTITLGGVPTVLNSLLAHLVRAEGAPAHASVGVALGGVLNIALDPLLIFGFGMGLTGAAAATVLSNCAALLYFIVYLRRRRRDTLVRLKPARGLPKARIVGEVVAVGLPGCMMTVMVTVSNVALNYIAASYSSAAIAGMGIAKKVNITVFTVAQGMTQGTLPLIGYNFASGNRLRMQRSIAATLSLSLIITVAGAALLYAFAAPIVRCFIADADTVACGQEFLRIICVICPSTAINFLVVTVFQATGKKAQPLFLSLLRKGILDVPLMFLLNRAFALRGVAWATPVADFIALAIALALFIPYMRRISRPPEDAQPQP